MKQAITRLMRRKSQPNHEGGMSLPEVMVSSFILVSVVTANMHMGNLSVKGMNSSDLRYKLDSAIAQRIEDLRKQAFEFLCVDTPGEEAGCIEGHSNKALAYDLTTLKPLCVTNNLGEQFRNHINANTNLLAGFNLQDLDPAAENVAIAVAATPSGNQLDVTLSTQTMPIAVSTTLVPHAQGWCP
jgi:hypothetical protein